MGPNGGSVAMDSGAGMVPDREIQTGDLLTA